MKQRNNPEHSITKSQSISTTLHVPEKLWKRLHRFAFTRSTKKQAVWLAALEHYLDTEEGKDR